MKKWMSLILAGMMMLICAFGAAENAVTTRISSESGAFEITFEMPEGARVISSGWTEGNLYQANILLKEGEYLYMAVDGSGVSAEGAPVTYNEENGYTDEKVLQMIDDLYGAEYANYDKQVVTTNYGTKIAVIRVNDEQSAMAYAWSVWNNFEIGFTLVALDAEGNYLPITDEQVQNMAAFASEIWMHVKISEDGAEAQPELTPEMEEVQAVSEWLGTTVEAGKEEEILNWDLETVKAKLEGYEGELKYHTKDELAEIVENEIQKMKAFMDAISNISEEDLAGLFYMIEPMFDGTAWVNAGQAVEIVCQDGLYKVAVAPTMQDIEDGTNTQSYLCELTEGDLVLTSISDGMEGENQADQGKGSTFTVIDKDDVDVLVWKNAEGQETEFLQYNRDYLGKFVSGEYTLEVTWEDGIYLMTLTKGEEVNLTYRARQESRAANLNGIYDENSAQADHGYCYFNYEEFENNYEFNNGDDLELTFTRAE